MGLPKIPVMGLTRHPLRTVNYSFCKSLIIVINDYQGIAGQARNDRKRLLTQSLKPATTGAFSNS
jgi:hypothetical protein